MAVFPLFIDLRMKRCVVVGGGSVAARKIETLLKFNANIVVISPEINETIQDLKWENKVVVIKKRYSEEDIEGAFLVIAATSDKKVNEKIYSDAVKNGIFVNVVDNPEKCTFIFPAVVKRSDLVVGISTSGAYPSLSKKIREKIETLIPEEYEAFIGTLKECRKRAESEIQSSSMRKEALNRILDEVLFYENAITSERMKSIIDNIFMEYKDEKGN